MGNSADSGDGIYCDSSSLDITNCIIWNSFKFENSTPIVTYSNMKGSYVKEGNIDIDPLFVDQSVGDYHLQFGSPCIDARNPNSFILEDKNGVARPQDGDGDDLAISDMGTYEYILTAKSDKLSCTGDLNEDVGITPLDALIAFQCYAGVGFCPKCADINQDGQVTVSDAFCIFQIYLGLANCLD